MSSGVAALIAGRADLALELGTLVALLENGRIAVRSASGNLLQADVLQSAASDVHAALSSKEPRTVLVCNNAESAVVLGVVDALASFTGKDAREISAAGALTRVRSFTVEAGDRIELKCGGSAIVLTKEGTVVVRGVDVSTRAKRTNKVKGATVQIN